MELHREDVTLLDRAKIQSEVAQGSGRCDFRSVFHRDV